MVFAAAAERVGNVIAAVKVWMIPHCDRQVPLHANLRHFQIFDISLPHCLALLSFLCFAVLAYTTAMLVFGIGACPCFSFV